MRVEVGAPAEVTFDAFPGRNFTGIGIDYGSESLANAVSITYTAGTVVAGTAVASSATSQTRYGVVDKTYATLLATAAEKKKIKVMMPTLDGHGLKMLQKVGITPAVITGRDSAPLRARLNALGIKHVRYGTEDKAPAAQEILNELGLNWSQASHMGDDWPDMAVMTRVAFACAPRNAHIEVKAIAHYVTERDGGHGAAREFCDLLLVASGHYANLLQGYVA